MERRETHETRVAVWDTPSAIERAAPFRIKIGVRCAAECCSAARSVEVRDADGRCIASALVGDLPWPGTAALYYAELELRAPDSEGLHVWDAYVPPAGEASGGHASHGAASARFGVHVVPAAECVLKVVALDARSRAPIAGAKVVLHPYRALTDAQGVAELRVPKGAYRLFVSGRNHFPLRSDRAIDSDMTIRAELEADLGPTDAELWT